LLQTAVVAEVVNLELILYGMLSLEVQAAVGVIPQAALQVPQPKVQVED
jgi:hypothetical protein